MHWDTIGFFNKYIATNMMVCDIVVTYEKVVLTLGAVISLASLFSVYFIYFVLKVPHLKRHATTLFLRRCLMEIIFVTQYLWIAFVPNNFFWTQYNDSGDDSQNCETNPQIWPLSWLTQFSLLGAELWFGAMSVDIHVSLTNPFSSPQAYDMYYRGAVCGFAGLMATILVSLTPVQYGVSTDPMIWVKDQEGKINWTKICMFYMFVPFVYAYGLTILIWARWQIHRGLEETLKARKYSVSKQSRYLTGYFCFYAVLYTFQFVIYLKEDFNAYSFDKSVEDGIRTFCAFLLASRGIWSLGIFVISNWYEIGLYLKREKSRRGSLIHTIAPPTNMDQDMLNPPKEEEELVQLNVALQKEIVKFTASGIRQALKAVESSNFNRSSSGRTSSSGPFIIFQTKLPGEAHIFMVDDVENSVDKTPASPALASTLTDNTSQAVEKEAAVSSMSATGINPIHNPARESLANTFRPSFRHSSFRGSAPSELGLEHPQSIDLINYNMMPKPMEGSRKDSGGPGGTSSTSNLSSRLLETIRSMLGSRNSFQFTDYSPKRFAKIRKLSGITTEQYQQSFTSTTMPDFSGGRSGAFVYFSSDYKYIVKTCTAVEMETLLNLLPEYEKYLLREYKKKRNSMLTRFMGAHRIVMYDIPLYFIVMKNICIDRVDEKYDIKGSWINRHGSKKKKDPALSRPKKSSVEELQSTPLFLDNDIQNAFMLKPEDAARLAKQLDRDTKFLQRFNLMDYSLLIGVKRKLFVLSDQSHGLSFDGTVVSPLPPVHNEDTTPLSAASVEGPGIFYIGLIDMLQEWNWSKWIERMFKVYVLRKDELGISAVEPNYYRVRFMDRAVIDVFDGLDKLPEVNDEEDEEDVLSSVSSRKDSERSSLKIESSEIDHMQQGSQSPIHSNFV